MASTSGLVAMTSGSHAEGRQFNPGEVYTQCSWDSAGCAHNRCAPPLRDQREQMCSFDMRFVGSQNDVCGLSSPPSARARSHVHIAMAPGGGGTSEASRSVGRAERVGQLGRAERAGQVQPVRPPDSHIPTDTCVRHSYEIHKINKIN